MADLEHEKILAAARAVEEVRPGMLVGLGTGRTAGHAVRLLAKRVRDGLNIVGTPTSRVMEELARSLGIRLTPFDRLARVDLTIDGADEIAPDLAAIKGGGGALLREKLVAAASDRMIVIADSGKLVGRLGAFPLPVEVLPFAAGYVAARLEQFAVPFALRMTRADPFLTDQGAHIFDISFREIAEPAALAAELAAIPGLIAHGLFLSEIDMAIVGRGNAVEIITRNR